MKPSKDNTFCWYPFHQLALKEWQEGKGIVNASPCCNSIRPETPDPIRVKQRLKDERPTAKELFYSEEMESIRQAMREGRRHPACETCWRIEDRALSGDSYSYRMMSAEPGRLQGLNENDDLIDNPQLQTIDFAFGENCNLRCRMCSPGLSNKLRQDYQFFYENKIDTSGINNFDYQAKFDEIAYNERNLEAPTPLDKIWTRDTDITRTTSETTNWDDGAQWQDILDNIHELRHIKATGGETLVSKPFEEFLDTAIARGVSKNIYIEFHTNATKFNDTIIDKLKQFDAVHLNLSIDSLGKNYEYIRYPMPWEKLDASLRNLLTKTDGAYTADGKMPFIKNFSFNVVLTALNAHYLYDLAVYQETLYREFNKWPEMATFYVDLLWPENKFTNVKFLPPKIKQGLIAQYKRIQSDISDVWIVLDTAINFLEEWQDYEPTEQDRLNMLREITIFDLSRNQDYHDFLHKDIIDFLETPLGL